MMKNVTIKVLLILAITHINIINCESSVREKILTNFSNLSRGEKTLLAIFSTYGLYNLSNVFSHLFDAAKVEFKQVLKSKKLTKEMYNEIHFNFKNDTQRDENNIEIRRSMIKCNYWTSLQYLGVVGIILVWSKSKRKS